MQATTTAASHPVEPLTASPRSDAGPVLRLAILIADTAGEILFSNPEAEQALEKLSHSVHCVDDIFTPEALDRLRSRRSWAAVSPREAAHLTWRVRARHMIDSGRSLFLFFADEPVAR
jgi:hypothetical protein